MKYLAYSAICLSLMSDPARPLANSVLRTSLTISITRGGTTFWFCLKPFRNASAMVLAICVVNAAWPAHVHQPLDVRSKAGVDRRGFSGCRSRLAERLRRRQLTGRQERERRQRAPESSCHPVLLQTVTRRSL